MTNGNFSTPPSGHRGARQPRGVPEPLHVGGGNWIPAFAGMTITTLLPVLPHGDVQEAHLLESAPARLAENEMQPKAQIQRQRDVTVLHLRHRPARVPA